VVLIKGVNEMSNLFFRRHYIWLAHWVREQMDSGNLNEAGAVALMNQLHADNMQFKPDQFWREVQEHQPRSV